MKWSEISRKKRFAITLVILVAGFSFFTGKYWNNKSSNQLSRPISENTGGGFKLMNHFGAQTSLSDFQGKVVFLIFGFTECPDICPTQLSSLSEMMGILGELSGEVQVLFVTVDPKSDTTVHMKEYLKNFHPSFLGLTGKVGQIKSVARQYQSSFTKEEKDNGEYEITHSSSFFLINQKGRIFGMYPHDTPATKLADEVMAAVDSRGMY